MIRAAAACRAAGCRQVFAVATHGVFVGAAAEFVASPLFDRIVVTDTLPPFRLPQDLVSDRLTVLSAAPLLGKPSPEFMAAVPSANCWPIERHAPGQARGRLRHGSASPRAAPLARHPA